MRMKRGRSESRGHSKPSFSNIRAAAAPDYTMARLAEISFLLGLGYDANWPTKAGIAMAIA